MMGLRAAQLAYDHMMPEDNEVPCHQFTGEILIDEVAFTFDDGEIVKVSFYDDCDDFIEVAYHLWTGDDKLACRADVEAQEQWEKELRHAH